MNRTRLVFFGILSVAVVIAYILLTNGRFTKGEEQGFSPKTQSEVEKIVRKFKTSRIVSVTIASSLTKQAWLERAIANFKTQGKTTSSGARIAVKAKPMLSGGSMFKILQGTIKPVVWSPGADSWVKKFNQEWAHLANKPIIGDACKPTIYTPIGLAMWRPMAEALGWPDKPIGWKTVVDLAMDPDGWATYGHPEWGKLRLGHPHPKYSSAGMLYLTSFAHGITGEKKTLSADSLYTPEVEAAFGTLAAHTSRYGMVSTDLLRLMVKEGPRYLHAVSAFESDTVRFNLNHANELRFPLAFIFPAEGTFWSSHPYCILDQADWVSEEQAEAARIFLDHLRTNEQQSLAVDNLLRPLHSDVPLHTPLDLAHGTDPRVQPETVPPLDVPSSEVTSAIIDLFMRTKRKATVLLVLDTSGSMKGEKIKTATQATAAFLERLHPDDRVGLFTFNNNLKRIAEPKRVGDVVERLSSQVGALWAEGGTALYSAVCTATKRILVQQEADRAAGDHRLYGIILLSDGADTAGHVSEHQMFRRCLPDKAEADGVKIFPIAFGKDANTAVLGRIARVTGGKLHTADTGSIDKIYQRISAEQ